MKINRAILNSDPKLKKVVYNYFSQNAGASKKEVDYLLSKHLQFETLIHSKDSFLCVFNLVENEAHINHLISIQCGVEGIRSIAKYIKYRYSHIENLVYEREFKKNSQKRRLPIKRFIK